MADEAPKSDPIQPARRRKTRDAAIEGAAVEIVPATETVMTDPAPETVAAPEPAPDVPSASGVDVVDAPVATSDVKGAPAQGPGLVVLVLMMLGGGALGAAALYFALLNGILPLPVKDGSIAAIEKTVSSLASRPLDPAIASRIDGLEAKVKAVEARLAGSASGAELAALRADISALKQQSAVSAPVASAGAAPVDLSSIEGRLKSGDAEVKALTIRLGQIDAEIASLGQAVRDGAGARGVLTEKVGQLDAKTAQSSTVGNKAALALAVSTLRNAFDNGNAFAGEYRALRNLAGDSPGLKVLEAASRTGIPATPVLRQRFRTLLPTLVKAVPAQSADGWLARARQSLEGIISIRHVGEAGGSEPQAVLARIDTSLQRNDLAKVVEDFALLPDPVKVAGKEWHDMVAARVAAEATLNTMARDALQALAETPK